jgi:hypothetical protein
MQDMITIGLYVLVFIVVRNASALLALLVFAAVAYTSSHAGFKYSDDDVYLFAILSIAYLMCATQMRRWSNPAWYGCIFVSLYSLYFSYDSWINWEFETWTYQNHESIVFTSHVLVMLLLSKVHLALVCSRVNLFWRNHCSNKSKQGN